MKKLMFSLIILFVATPARAGWLEERAREIGRQIQDCKELFRPSGVKPQEYSDQQLVDCLSLLDPGESTALDKAGHQWARKYLEADKLERQRIRDSLDKAGRSYLEDVERYPERYLK